MPIKIIVGEKETRERQVREVWPLVKSAQEWGTQPPPEKWEAIRRMLVYVLKKDFPDLVV